MAFRARAGTLVLFAAFLAACSDSNQDAVTGDGSIRGIHAVPELGTVTFLIEETTLATLDYKQASGIAEYDDLDYNFSFDLLLPGDSEETRLVTENVDVDSETDYTFVLCGTLENPGIILWEQPARDWEQELELAEENDEEVTVMEISVGHLDEALGPVDVYIESPGTSPQHAVPRGTVDYAELLPAVELAEGDYQLIVTPPDTPTTILFASNDVSLSAATSNLFTIMDSGGLTTADFVVRHVGLGADLTGLFDESQLTVMHAAYGTDGVDVVVGDNFAAPLVSELRFAEWAESVTIDDAPANLIVTPAGNPGVFLAQQQIDVGNGTYNRLMLAGLPGMMQAVLLADDRRTLATHARVQIFQGAVRFQTLDIYLVADDVDITLTGPSYSSVLFGGGVAYQAVAGQTYNFFLAEADTKNVVGGPFRLDLQAGRNYSIVIVDAPDITAADILVFDQTPE